MKPESFENCQSKLKLIGRDFQTTVFLKISFDLHLKFVRDKVKANQKYFDNSIISETFVHKNRNKFEYWKL